MCNADHIRIQLSQHPGSYGLFASERVDEDVQGLKAAQSRNAPAR